MTSRVVHLRVAPRAPGPGTVLHPPRAVAVRIDPVATVGDLAVALDLGEGAVIGGLVIDGRWLAPGTLLDPPPVDGALVAAPGDPGTVATGAVASPPPGRHRVVRPPRVRPPAPVVPPPPPTGPPDPAPPPATSSLGALAGAAATAVALAALAGPRLAALALVAPAAVGLLEVVRRARRRRDAARGRRAHQAAVVRHRADLAAAATGEARRRRLAQPTLTEVLRRIDDLDPRLWERRPGDPDAFTVPLGRTTAIWPDPGSPGPAPGHGPGVGPVPLVDVPAVLDLTRHVAVVGPEDARRAVARALVVAAAGLHGPADLRLAVLADPAGAHHTGADGGDNEGDDGADDEVDRGDEWAWARWLPHTDGPGGAAVSGTDVAVEAVVDAIAATAGDGRWRWVVIDGPGLVAELDRPARPLLTAPDSSVLVLAATAEEVPPGIDEIWVVDDRLDLARRDDLGGAALASPLVHGDGLGRLEAERSAARLARCDDPELPATARPLPDAVHLVELLGLPSVDAAAIERCWLAGGDRDGLAVPLGIGGDGPVVVDLVTDGPHMLVAGTTGAGKSELLRTLVAAWCATTDPRRLNLVLVDYKGGSAFDACAALPHVAAVVTDLDGGLAERALHCLDAELHRRERILRAAGVGDLSELHRARGALDAPGTPARLVVVVDEFAALAAELPGFVDSLVDVARRGRSLGVHLVLATQRPAGCISDHIRANVALRVALRVLDPAESRDVIDDPAAAALPRRRPGRAVARLAPGELVTFQAALVTGTTDRTTLPVRVVDASTTVPSGPSDLAALVAACGDAASRLGIEPPRPPWPPPLPSHVSRASCAPTRAWDDDHDHVGDEPSFLFGLTDRPDEQRITDARWQPARGPLLVLGLAGAGTSTTLRSIARAAACTPPPEGVHVYALDHGAGALSSLTSLAVCGAVVRASEHERRAALWRRFDELHRSRRDGATGPLVVLLVDNAGAVCSPEHPDGHAWRELLLRVATDGPALGLGLVVAADRVGALGHALDAAFGDRLLLRLADASDYAAVGRRGVSPLALGPGRGWRTGGVEVQVAIDDDPLPGAPRGSSVGSPPPRIEVLPSRVHLPARHRRASAGDDGSVRIPVGRRATDHGVADLVLGPHDHAVVTGTARAGASSTLAALAHAGRAAGWPVHVLAPGRSPLRGLVTTDGIDPDGWAGAPHGLVLVDDADRVEDPALDVLVADGPPGWHVIAALRSDRARGLFRHWTIEVRRSRTGVLLHPDDGDGELLGVRLPRTTPPELAGGAAATPGRGFLVHDGVAEIVQVALPVSGCDHPALQDHARRPAPTQG